MPVRRPRFAGVAAAVALLAAALLVAAAPARLAAAPAGAGAARGVEASAAEPTTQPAGKTAARPEIAIYAAASLYDALHDLQARCEADTGAALVVNAGGSNDLARQIVAAGKADLFISANQDWMDVVEKAGRLLPGTRRALLSNRLVVIVPQESRLVVRGPADLAGPSVRRLALADPALVPAGLYARAWLERAGQWALVEERVVPALDVRAALAAVESGGADAGVVYATDAAIARHSRVAYEVPAADAPAVVYVLGVMSGRPHAETARRVADWLAGPEGRDAFVKRGFGIPGTP